MNSHAFQQILKMKVFRESFCGPHAARGSVAGPHWFTQTMRICTLLFTHNIRRRAGPR